jgi:hypothetical protein
MTHHIHNLASAAVYLRHALPMFKIEVVEAENTIYGNFAIETSVCVFFALTISDPTVVVSLESKGIFCRLPSARATGDALCAAASALNIVELALEAELCDA